MLLFFLSPLYKRFGISPKLTENNYVKEWEIFKVILSCAVIDQEKKKRIYVSIKARDLCSLLTLQKNAVHFDCMRHCGAGGPLATPLCPPKKSFSIV